MSALASPPRGAIVDFLADRESNSTVDVPYGPDVGRSRLDFELPRELEADRPPEARGLARDEVRLMVVKREDPRIEHARFRDLPDFLAPGDLLVVNTSSTLPAAIPARRPDGGPIELRFATAAPQIEGDEWWVIELRSADGVRPFRGLATAGERLELPDDARAELVAPYMASRLWLARLEATEALHPYLVRHGHPIRYAYVADEWPLEAYQTVFANEAGSAEMPSAGRPFTAHLVARLIARGVQIAPITLHTGVSSPELGEAPYPERYRVPEPTARLVNAAREAGGRVIAVGTTVVRALETVAGPGSRVAAGEGWTNLVIGPQRRPRTIDGLLTGWHEPRASHLEVLAVVAGDSLLERSYEAALANEYRWHEFGDSHLILTQGIHERRRQR